jgi:hypothetical protein
MVFNGMPLVLYMVKNLRDSWSDKSAPPQGRSEIRNCLSWLRWWKQKHIVLERTKEACWVQGRRKDVDKIVLCRGSGQCWLLQSSARTHTRTLSETFCCTNWPRHGVAVIPRCRHELRWLGWPFSWIPLGKNTNWNYYKNSSAPNTLEQSAEIIWNDLTVNL